VPEVSVVSVVVSDPWSFVTEHGSSFTAAVRAQEGPLVLLEMDGRLYVATPRGDSEEGRYNLVPTTDEHSGGEPPWGSDLWRGQPPALLADIHGL
jgi:hypothetical protein